MGADAHHDQAGHEDEVEYENYGQTLRSRHVWRSYEQAGNR
jgi:hypothetical protein